MTQISGIVRPKVLPARRSELPESRGVVATSVEQSQGGGKLSRVPVVLLAPNMGGGGAERQTYMLIRDLDRDRFEPVLVALGVAGHLYDQSIEDGVECHFIGVRSKLPVAALFRLVGLLRKKGRGILVMWGFSATTLGRMAAPIAGRWVTVVVEHSAREHGEVPTFNRLVGSALRPLTDAWVYVSRAGQLDFLVDYQGVPEERTHCIANGVEIPVLADDAKARARAKLGLDPHDFVVGIVAVMRPEKEHSTFLRAAALLRQDVPQARFVVVGDGPERPEIERMVDDLGLRDAVILTGRRRDVPDILPGFDVFSLTSRAEALPLAILEAMATGLPVVATGVGGVSEAVTDGVSGFVIEPGDYAGLAAAWRRLAEDGGLRRSMATAAKARVERDYTAMVMARGYEDLFATITDLPPCSAPAAPT